VSIALSAFLLGIAFCLPPGAVFAETLRRAASEPDARRAYGAAIRVQLGSVIGDLAWAVLALIGAAFLVQNAAARIGLGALGALLMAWLAWSALRDAWRGAAPAARTSGARGSVALSPLRVGVLLALGNPFAVTFWLGLGGGSVAGMVDPTASDLLTFFGSFTAATIVYAFVVAALAGYGRRFLGPRTFRLMNAACGLFLAYKAIELAIALISS